MTVANYIEICGFFITLIGVIYALTRSYRNSENKEEKTANQKFALIIGALGTIMTLVISIRYDYIGKFLENNIVEKDPTAFKVGQAVANSNYQIKQSSEKLTKLIYNNKLDEINELLEQVNDKEFFVASSEFSEYAPKIFELAKSNSKIIATSYIKPDDWWKTNWGENYLNKNYEAISDRNCTIDRVYIFPDSSEFKAMEELMKIQKSNGINVFWAMADEIRDKVTNKYHILTQDIIIVGDMLSAKLFLTDNREPTHIIFYTDKKAISKMRNNYDRLRAYIKEY